ncbi:MAG TPA: twin-arginine translocase TatA/TatE family subunit [Candidatus Dormibacteraeota bacterium]
MPIHPLWLLLIAAIVLIIFGPKRLPELGSALGRGLREFRKASEQLHDEVTRPTEPSSTPPGPHEADRPTP